MSKADSVLSSTPPRSKPDTRQLWRLAYAQARAQIRTDGRFGLDRRLVHCLDHMRRRFGPAGWPVAQRAARLVLDRRTACRGATGTVADLQRQGLVDRAGRPVRCVSVERCRSWRIAWSVDPLADVNGRRADRAYRVRRRREVARILAADRLVLDGRDRADAGPTPDRRPSRRARARPPHPDAELLALGAELEALGRGLHDWPGDDEVERLDARLAEVEDRIAALAPATGAGLAVKLRLACAWRPAAGPALPCDPRPGGGLARLLRRLVAEAEALDRAPEDLP